jgi:hypothetical protein
LRWGVATLATALVGACLVFPGFLSAPDCQGAFPDAPKKKKKKDQVGAGKQKKRAYLAVRSDGALMRKGTPFFPIGMYCEGVKTLPQAVSAVKLLGKNNFNFACLVHLTVPDYHKLRAQTAGSGVLIMQYYPQDLKWVTPFANDPQLLGHYILDDANFHTTMPGLRKLRDTVVRSAPLHPTTCSFAGLLDYLMVTHRVVRNGKATLTVKQPPHTKWAVGNDVTVGGMAEPYLNGVFTLTAVSDRNFSFAVKHRDVAPGAEAGASGSIVKVSLSGNLATYTTSAPHGLMVNQKVVTAGVKVAAGAFNLPEAPVFSVLSPTTFTVALTRADVAPTRCSGKWHASATIDVHDTWAAVPHIPHVQYYTIVPKNTIAKFSLTSNVVTITTNEPHHLYPGIKALVKIGGDPNKGKSPNSFASGTYTVLKSPAPTTFEFSYTLAHANVRSTAESGAVQPSDWSPWLWDTWLGARALVASCQRATPPRCPILDIQCYRPKGWRYPTAPEIDVTTWLSLMGGVKGLCYYSYWGGIFATRPVNVDAPATWAQCVRNAAEARALKDYLLDGELLVTDCPNRGKYYYAVWAHKGKRLIAVANADSAQALAVSIPLPRWRQGKSSLKKLFAYRPNNLSVAKGTLRGRLPALAVEVYEY